MQSIIDNALLFCLSKLVKIRTESINIKLLSVIFICKYKESRANK